MSRLSYGLTQYHCGAPATYLSVYEYILRYTEYSLNGDSL